MAKFKVSTTHGGEFRRNGVLFTREPQVVDSVELGWTEAQVRELHASASVLLIEEVKSEPKAEKSEPKVK